MNVLRRTNGPWAGVAGSGAAFPPTVESNTVLNAHFDLEPDWIEKHVGVRQRHVCRPGHPEDFNSSLGACAAAKALNAAGVHADQIGLIVYATATADSPTPSNACRVQRALAARHAAAFDLNAACAGFLYAVAVAEQAIRAGACECALVIGADVLTRCTHPDDRAMRVLSSDGAGAVVLTRTALAAAPWRIVGYHFGADGGQGDLVAVTAGGTNVDLTPELVAAGANKIKMQGKALFPYAVDCLVASSQRVLRDCGMGLRDVDWILPHQSNLRMLEAVADRLGVPMTRVLVNIDRRGNTGAATVPTLLDEAIRDGRIRHGQTILSTVIGAGIAYGAMLFQ